MNDFNKLFFEICGETIKDSFSPSATYFHDLDYVEYLIRDTTSVSRRIDQFLTVLIDGEEKKLIGFRLKGFRHIFNEKRIKSLRTLHKSDFLRIATVIEALVQQLGDELMGDDERTTAYRQALQLAEQAQVTIPEGDYEIA